VARSITVSYDDVSRDADVQTLIADAHAVDATFATFEGNESKMPFLALQRTEDSARSYHDKLVEFDNIVRNRPAGPYSTWTPDQQQQYKNAYQGSGEPRDTAALEFARIAKDDLAAIK
jgi:hypothetical protein